MNATAHLHITPPEADNAGSELLTIGEVSRLYGVTLRALRFYEQRGLLKPIRRGGARFYDGVQKVRLQMILKGKHLGFTLTEIADLLERGVAPGDVAAQARTALENLRVALGDAGAGLEDVVRMTVYVASTDRGDLVTAWTEIRAAFGEMPPATLLGVAVLGYPDQLVEVDAVAAMPG